MNLLACQTVTVNCEMATSKECTYLLEMLNPKSKPSTGASWFNNKKKMQLEPHLIFSLICLGTKWKSLYEPI